MEERKELLLIIPAYNEEQNIGRVLDSLRAERITEYADLLVINDASSDRTREVVLEQGIHCITQIYNMGYGASLQTGYKYAAERGYEYVIQIDADGQHGIENIQMLYQKLTAEDETGNRPDIVIGSRFLNEKNEFKVSAAKKAAISFLRWAIRLSTKSVITDPTSGLQGLNRRAFQNYAEYGNFDIKYPDANMLIQMLMREYRIVEIPAVMYMRESGKSMHSGLKPLLYGMLMPISVVTIILRERKVHGKRH